MLFFGFGSFPALTQRGTVDLLMSNFLANSVPLMYFSPVIDARLACMALYRNRR